MSHERALFRLGHVRAAIGDIRRTINDRSFDALAADGDAVAALKWHLLVLSEASRHIPAEWKSQYEATIKWRSVADLGNELRHGYHHVDLRILWDIYKNDLAPLEAAIEAMIAEYGPIP